MTPIAPLVTSFLREHMPAEQGCSPHSCETYAHALRLLFIFASERLSIRPSQISLEQIDATLILSFLAYIEQQRSNSAATRNGRLEARSDWSRSHANWSTITLRRREACGKAPRRCSRCNG